MACNKAETCSNQQPDINVAVTDGLYVPFAVCVSQRDVIHKGGNDKLCI